MSEQQVVSRGRMEADIPAVRTIELERPWAWLHAGWLDLLASPLASLGYGIVFAGAGFLLTFGLWRLGLWYLVLPMACGFLILGPVASVGLYDLSRRRAERLPIVIERRTILANGSQIALMGLALLLFFFAWIRLAAMVFMLFFGLEPPPIDQFLSSIFLAPASIGFIVVGFGTGAILAGLAFAISVVSIPLLLDRPRANVVTAILTSVQAVRRNPLPLALWAALIGLFIGAGLVTFYLGLVIAMPLIAHASWHAYRDLVEA